tara:strand:+ start:34609 stop:35460 length:852 start_codon:yes stop_codon:yes gene_type:complete
LPSVREIRRRIKSVQSTAKVTKAMSMIAASKMRKTQEAALLSRPYNEMIGEIVNSINFGVSSEESLHPLLEKREIKTTQLILITPDRGLTGGLNNNVNRFANDFMKNNNSENLVIAVGKKGFEFIDRSEYEISSVFTDIGESPEIADVLPISKIAIDNYVTGKVDAVSVIFSEYVSSTLQKPDVLPLLPMEQTDSKNLDFISEPNINDLIKIILPKFVEVQIFHCLLESIASEQSARMVAMQKATDAANEMIDDLTLKMNKARQEMITNELLDIVGGVEAQTS